MRYADLKELLKNVSPDVIIEDDDPELPNIVAKSLKKSEGQAGREILEAKFRDLWERLGGSSLVAQHKFHPTRRWRFDFADVEKKVAFEVQGGIYAAQSGHRSFEGVQRDYEKFNAATLAGWAVFQITSMHMKDAAYIEEIIDFVRKR